MNIYLFRSFGCPKKGYICILFEDTLSLMQERKEIIKSWLAGQCSSTLIIPKDFAKYYDLDEPSYGLIEKKPKGILIRKIGS